MSVHRDTLAKALRGALGAVGHPLYGESSVVAAKILETLLNDWYGLEVVSRNDLCAGIKPDLQLVRVDDDGKVSLPDSLDLPLSPKRAHRLGVALIGGANLGKRTRRNSE